MSPEHLRGQTVTFSCDIYSLGVVFYEILFGTCPFEDTVLDELIRKKEQN